MYQQIPPSPYQPSSYQPPCPPYSYQQPYPPYGDPSGLSRPIGAAFVPGLSYSLPSEHFSLVSLPVSFLSAFSMAASEISDNSWSQYDDPYNYGAAHSYGLNETAGVSGTLYDLSFSACSFDADVTLTSYLRGDQAADKILEMGGGSKRPARWNGICDSDLSNQGAQHRFLYRCHV